jgi:thiol-disulfide isomerase/thioredoxin
MKIKAILTGLIIFSLSAGACSASGAGAPDADAEKFKHEYEILNDQTVPDGEHQYRAIEIPADNPFVYIDGDRAKELLEGGTGVLYMGFPECPWCRTLLPVLLDAQKATGYAGEIYYYNALDDRDVLSLDDAGNLVTEEEGAPVYHELVKILYDSLEPYGGLNDESIRRIYLPTTVFFKDGVVTGVHLDTLDSQESGYDVLTDGQYAELLATLSAEFETVLP